MATISDLPALHGASWGPGDVIVFASRGSLYRVAAAGGVPELLAAPDSTADGPASFRWPDVLPDGRTVVFTQVVGNTSTLAALSLEDSRVTSLAQPGMSPRYVDGGFLVFTQTDGTLFSAPFDARRARFTGRPQPIVDGITAGPAQVAKVGIARSGALAFLSGTAGFRELVLADRDGRVEALALPPARYRSPRFSPEGRRLAMSIDYGPAFSGDVWTYEFGGGALTRLTFDSVSSSPSWSPDGSRILYSRIVPPTEFDLHWVAADGSGLTDTVYAAPLLLSGAEFTPDGRAVVFQQEEGMGRSVWDLWMVPVDSPQAARPLLATRANEFDPTVSLDGRWLAYVSNATGSYAVYLRGLRGGGRIRVSPGEGVSPRWGTGGRELFYQAGDSLLVVGIRADPELSRGPPRVVLKEMRGALGYDLHPDGQRIIWVRDRETDTRAIGVLLHWFDQLRPRSGRRTDPR